MKSYLFLGIILFSNAQAIIRLPRLGSAIKSRNYHIKPKDNSTKKNLDYFWRMVGHQLWQLEKNLCTEIREEEILRATSGYLSTINMQEEYGDILYEAVDQKDKKIIKVLCAVSSVDFILKKNEDGISAWGYAIEFGDVEIIKVFLEAFGDKTMRCLTERQGWQGMTPLHFAVKIAQENSCFKDIYLKYKKIIQMLLKAAGSDAPWLVIAVNNENRTPLVYADDETRGMLLKVLGLSVDKKWDHKE